MASARERLRTLTRSLRFRVATGIGLILAIALLLLTANAIRLSSNALLEREEDHLAQMRSMMESLVIPYLERNDRAGLQLLLERVRGNRDLMYLVLLDAEQQVIATSGWLIGTPLPARHQTVGDVPLGETRYDGYLPLRTGNRLLGYLYFGLETRDLQSARLGLALESIGIGAAVLLGALLLVVFVSYLLMRDLGDLGRGFAALERGRLRMKLPVHSGNEVGQLTRAFNTMAQTLEERVEALKKSEARFHAIADYTFGVEAWFNPDGRLIWINRSVERVTGYTPLECVLAGNLLETLVHPKDRRNAVNEFLNALQGGTGENFEVRLQRKDGSIVWVAMNWQPIYSAEGRYLGLRVSATEIQARKEAEYKLLDTVTELRRAQSLKAFYLNRSEDERLRLQALLNALQVGILFVGRDGRVVYFNKSLLRIWGFPPDTDLMGMRDAVLLDRTAALRQDDDAFRKHLAEMQDQRPQVDVFEVALTDGRLITHVSALVLGQDSEKSLGRVWIFEDVTERQRLQNQLVQLAVRDPLTNLFNRRRFHEELERSLADASRRGVRLGLLMIDLDGFKPINDQFGHQAGDTVLVEVSKSVSAIIRRNEMFFRLGGDEFAVLTQDTQELEMIGLGRRIAGRIADLRFEFDGRSASLTASVGVALYPQHALAGEQLVACADAAMYQAKGAGKSMVRVFRPRSAEAAEGT